MKKGFTFLELIITVFVFITGVLGTFLISQHFIFATNVSISRLTASFLAQEGIEIVRNLRDENWLNDRNWIFGLSWGEWQSSYDDPSLNILENNGLMYIDGNGLYSHNNVAGSTRFKRKITIQLIDESIPLNGIIDYASISVLITWEQKNKSYGVRVKENLYPWW